MARILIVEDEMIVAHSIKNTLLHLHHSVCGIAVSGDEAIDLSSKGQPELVFMDVKLRGTMDGVEAAQRIMKAFDIPVIFMTAHSDDETVQRIKETNPYGYILKPFEPNDLRLAIEIAVFRHVMVKRLRQSEERYRIVSEIVSDFAMSYLIDDNGGMTQEWVTDAFDHITGYASAERQAFGGWISLCLPDDIDYVRSQYQSVTRTGKPVVFEARIKRKDGDIRWLRTYVRPMWDTAHKRIERLIGAGQDITDKKRAEEKINQESSFRRAIEASMRAGIVAVDTTGKQVYVNPCFADMLGWPEQELLNATPPFVYWPESEIGRINEAFQQTLQGNAPNEGYELVY